MNLEKSFQLRSDKLEYFHVDTTLTPKFLQEKLIIKKGLLEYIRI